MPFIVRFYCILLLACLSPMAQAERLRLVTDDWAPYVYQHNGQPQGIDYEVTTEVFRRLGIELEWEFMPWKRCLSMIEHGQADGVMDIFKVDSRQAYMVYPLEPMSDVEFVLYQSSHRRHTVNQMSDLTDLTVGTSPGYAYGAQFNDASGFRREAAPSHEANFGKLVLGRIDLLITDRLVGRYLRRHLGLEQQVEELPLVISRQAQYLGLARKPGRDALALAFSEELRRFKEEPAYLAIIERYIGSTGHLPHTVEQQESSTQR